MNLSTCQVIFQDKKLVLAALDGLGNERVAALSYVVNGDVLTVTGAIPLRNTHSTPIDNFKVADGEMRKVHGRFIIAHSHPQRYHNVGPSKTDIETLKVKYGAVFMPREKMLILFSKEEARTILMK